VRVLVAVGAIIGFSWATWELSGARYALTLAAVAALILVARVDARRGA